VAACTTVTDIWVVRIAEVPEPVIVSVYVPVGAVELAETVSAEVPPEVTVVGINDAVSPVGTFATEKVTL